MQHARGDHHRAPCSFTRRRSHRTRLPRAQEAHSSEAAAWLEDVEALPSHLMASFPAEDFLTRALRSDLSQNALREGVLSLTTRCIRMEPPNIQHALMQVSGIFTGKLAVAISRHEKTLRWSLFFGVFSERLPVHVWRFCQSMR